MTLSLYAMRVRLLPGLVAALPLDLGQIDAFLDHLVERRELAQAPHGAHDLSDREVDLLALREPAEAEADRAVRQLVSDLHRAQDVARFQAGARAGRARGDRQVLDAHDQRLALDVGE